MLYQNGDHDLRVYVCILMDDDVITASSTNAMPPLAPMDVEALVSD